MAAVFAWDGHPEPAAGGQRPAESGVVTGEPGVNAWGERAGGALLGEEGAYRGA